MPTLAKRASLKDAQAALSNLTIDSLIRHAGFSINEYECFVKLLLSLRLNPPLFGSNLITLKKLKNDNKAKANPGKAAAKKEKNDNKRERR